MRREDSRRVAGHRNGTREATPLARTAALAAAAVVPAGLVLAGGVLDLATARGRVLVDLGWRLVAVGAAGGAIGNAFAPLVLPSTVGFDPDVMGRFVHQHETSWASFAILGVYALLPVGSLLLATGLVRARTAPTWLAVLLPVGLGVITPLRLGIESIVDGVVVAVALTSLHRIDLPREG
jgi:hypothetical protein